MCYLPFESAPTPVIMQTGEIICAGLPLTNSRTYSAAFTDDAHFAVDKIQRRFPDAPLFAAGYSLGSLILTKYLAEAGTGKWVGNGAALCAALSKTDLLRHTGSSGHSGSPDFC